MYKQLIEDVNKENFNTFAMMVVDHNIDVGEVLSGPQFEKLVDAASHSDSFKAFLYAGYVTFLRQAISNMNIPQQIELLHASRFGVGMNLGFKYAMYLHEQRELASLGTK